MMFYIVLYLKFVLLNQNSCVLLLLINWIWFDAKLSNTNIVKEIDSSSCAELTIFNIAKYIQIVSTQNLENVTLQN